MGTRLVSPTDVEATVAAPGVSEAGNARFYYDQTLQQFRISQNAGPYQYMFTDLLFWGFNNPGANAFGTPFSAANAATELVGQFVAPKDSTLAGLFIRALNANFSAGGNLTLRVNGANSALVAAFANTGNLFADDANLVQVARGDLLSVQTSAAFTNNPVICGVLLLPK